MCDDGVMVRVCAGIRPIVNMGSPTSVRFPLAAADALTGTAGSKHRLGSTATLAFRSVNAVLQDLRQVSSGWWRPPSLECTLSTSYMKTGSLWFPHGVTLKRRF